MDDEQESDPLESSSENDLPEESIDETSEPHPTDEVTRPTRPSDTSLEEAADRFRRLLTSEDEVELPPTPPFTLDEEPIDYTKLTVGWLSEQSKIQAELESETGPTEATPPSPSEERPTTTTPDPLPDEEVSPLPQPVSERDLDATQVSPTAYIPPASTQPIKPATPPPSWSSGCGGCLLRLAILSLFVLVAIVIGVVSFGLYQYYALAATLPPVEDLRERAAKFETTRILDREGNLLYEILDPQAGRRTYVPLDQISPYMVAAVIATEDSQFYSHPGFDIFAIARAYVQNFQQRTIVSGASTITQQIARSLLINPEERSQVTARRKSRELLLAAEITRRYSKDEILELYLNQFYYGNLAYGVEAAAETYFNTTAAKLTLSQASFLAGLLQAPSVYDVFTNREATLARQQQVLALMVQTSEEQGCIYVSNSQQPICVSPENAGAAAAELYNHTFTPVTFPIRYPHWVFYIRSELESLFDPQTIYRSGFTVHTSLDPQLQEEAQDMVQAQVEQLADRRVSNGALVAIQPNTGEILAMVGSADFFNEEIDGQVNMAVRPRQPGSAFKPITYTAAFEKGWTPATLIWDVPSEFPPSGNPTDPRPPYKPVNYDERFHGPVTARSALASSYNVPAVKTLDFVGIYDDPTTSQEEGVIAVARRLGITTLEREDYGLALTLGGGEVTLLELTGVYAIFANGGLKVPPVGIMRIVDNAGEIVYEYQQPPGNPIIRPEHAYLITSILSDNAARTPAFGPNSLLNLPFTAAAKTGTTNDFRDNWTLGFTPDIAVGVWVGNADFTPMENTSGLTGAGPIWNQFMPLALQYLTGGQPTPFTSPAGILDLIICSISGTEPSEWCPSHTRELFAADQPPFPKDQDLWRKTWVDSYSLELASADCPDFAVEKLGLFVKDVWGQKWIKEDRAGQRWAEEMGFEEENLFFIPEKSCTKDSPRPILGITDPSEGSTVTTEMLPVFGRAAGTDDFDEWVLEYGLGYNPLTWTRITRSDAPHDQPDKLVDWDLREVPNGPVTLRLTVFSNQGGEAEANLHLTINLPTPTPVPSLTPTSTSTITPTNTITNTPFPSATPTPSLTPSWTPSITSTPSVTNTPTNTSTPTPTP